MSVASFARNEQGQDLIEYALLAALISTFVVGAVSALGVSVSGLFWDSAADAVADATP